MKPILFSTPNETWKPIKGCEGCYEISDLGRVKSLARHRRSADVILRHWIGNKGYHYIDLRHSGGKKKTHGVHRLVLEAFVGECPTGKMALHSDDNKDNNALSNLRWGNAKENADDRKMNGRTASGEKNGAAKLDAKCVKIINELKDKGLSAGKVAHLACVNAITIERIWSGESWREIV